MSPIRGVLYILVAAASFVVAGLLLTMLFRHESPYPSPIEGLAFAVPTPKRAPGIAVSASVSVDECDPWVHVTVVGEEPLEYWRAMRGRVDAATPVAFAILGSEVRDLQIGPAAPGDPLLDDSILYSSEASIRSGEFQRMGSESLGDGSAVGAVIRHWGRSRTPLRVSFSAKWASETGFHECTLHLPPLVGGELDDEYGAADGFLSTRVDGYQRRLGQEGFRFASIGRIEILNADVDRGASSPVPRLAAESAYYSCHESPEQGRTLAGGRLVAQARTRSLSAMRSAASAYRCDATVVISDSVHDRLFNVLLLAVGVMLSLGATAFFEAASSGLDGDWHRGGHRTSEAEVDEPVQPREIAPRRHRILIASIALAVLWKLRRRL